MQHDWFMYHLRSTYKNRLEFPFKFYTVSKTLIACRAASAAQICEVETMLNNTFKLPSDFVLTIMNFKTFFQSLIAPVNHFLGISQEATFRTL